jgi:zinc/manganese transport system substrate-binding protein
VVRRVVVAALGALSAIGCAVSPPEAAAHPITVVATTSAWGSILSQLGGDRVHAVSLISNPNTDPHDYEPTPADARALSLARLVVENGLGYDGWAARVLAASPDSRRHLVIVGDLVDAPSDGNPHLWYSPADVQALADAVTSALRRIDPADAGYFSQQRVRFDQLLTRYRSLIDDIRARYAGVPVGASESVVGPLAEALGLDLVTPPALLRAVSEGVDPSATDKTTVDRQIREHTIKVFIVNRQNSTPDVTAQVDAARSAGIPVVDVTETLSPASASYQSWQVGQLEQLRAALQQATGR